MKMVSFLSMHDITHTILLTPRPPQNQLSRGFTIRS